MLLSSLAWLFSVWQGHRHFNVVEGEVSRATAEGSLQPVLVDLAEQSDHVALAEGQLSVVLRLKVIQSSAARLGCGQ